MKQSKLLFLFVVLMSMASYRASAYDIAVKNADGVTIYYNYINDGKELAVTRLRGPFSSYSGYIKIPESVFFMDRNHEVTVIEEEAFSEANLKYLSIPSSIKKIEENAFSCTIEKMVIKDLKSWLKIDIGKKQKWKIYHLYDETNVEITNLIIPDDIIKIGDSVFSNFFGITSVSIPNSVTNIGKQAFSGCTELASLTISEGVVKIGSYAFSGCNKLQSVTIPSSVDSIGNNAFSNCGSLRNLTISDGVKCIGDYAFESCGWLYSITIPKSVSSIGVAPFSNCNPRFITVDPDNPKYDSRNNCNAIISTETNCLIQGAEYAFIPNNVTSIANSAFRGCYMESVTIPQYIKSIDSFAFRGVNLKKITSLIKEPSYISDMAFDDNVFYNVSLIVPRGTVGIYKKTAGWRKFLYIEQSEYGEVDGINYKFISDSECEVANKDDYSGDIVIPETVDENGVTYTVSSIGVNAFLRSSITSVVIPKSVKKIGMHAFFECNNLTSVKLGDGVEEIGKSAFCQCYNLTSVKLGDGVKVICDDAFMNDGNLTTLEMGHNVESIGEYAFASCRELTLQDVFPKLVTIGNKAFNNCSSLTICPIGDKVVTIGQRAFSNCSNITKVSIPNSVKTIGQEAFAGCDSIKELYIGSSVDEIGYRAFFNNDIESVVVDAGNKTYDSRDNCNAIVRTDINELLFAFRNTIIPNSIITIGKEAFQGAKMKSIIIPNSVTTIKEMAFYGCNSLVSIDMPNSITNIGANAFDYCKNLSSVSLSENLTTIEECAFRFCNLTSITIPDKSKTIKNGAFTGTVLESIIIGSDIEEIWEYAFGSKLIKDVYCKAINVPKTSKGAFLYDNQGCVIGNATLHVPAESIEKYKASSPWNKFKEIVALKDEDTEIKSIILTNDVKEIRSINGEKLQTPSKGINIIKMKDGTVKKVLVK